MMQLKNRMFSAFKISRNYIIWGGMCMLITLGLSVLMICPGHSWGGDFSQYIAQARALATGDLPNWYEKNSFIINNSMDGLGSEVYPWGFPLLLAPLYHLWGQNLFAFKLLEVVLLAGCMLVLFCYFFRRMLCSEAFALTLLIAVNEMYLGSVDSILSDIPCMFFSVLAIYCIELYLKSSERHFINGMLAGFFMFVAFQTRTMAITLLMALVCLDGIHLLNGVFTNKVKKDILHLQYYNNRKWYCYVVPYIVFAAGIFLSNSLLPGAGGTYLSYFNISFTSVLNMGKNYLNIFQNVLGLLWILFLILSVVGMLSEVKNELYLIIYVAGTMTMLLIYRYNQGARFLFSVFPYIYLFSFYGAKRIYRMLINKRDKYIRIGKVVCVICFAMIIAQYLAQDIDTILTRRAIGEPQEAYSADAEDMFDYINKNIDDKSIIYFFKPRVLYLNTNVYAYTWGDRADMLYKADYLLFYEMDGYSDCKMYAFESDAYQVIYQNNSFVLYQYYD